MADPARFVAGMTQDLATQPLGLCGFPNPFFYAVDSDDFMVVRPSAVADYTQTITAGGTFAGAAGAGGLALFTTNASTPLATDQVEIQRPVQSFAAQATQKLAYLASITAPDYLNPAFRFGLMALTGTPFTGLPDGIYFSKATGTAQLTLQCVVGGVVTGTAVVPITLVNGTQYNIGYVYAPQGNAGIPSIVAFVGNSLVGQATVDYNTIALGPNARVIPTALPAVNLTLTAALQSGTTTSKTLTLDYHLAALER